MDWIKVEHQTIRKSEIIRLARILKTDDLTVIGACVKFWIWADGETEDGFLVDADESLIDHAVGLEGFAKAMIDVGWLQMDTEKVHIPNWDVHHGNSAKKRALDARRQKTRRAKQGVA